jgi:flagellar assembly protein FliH
MSAKLIKAGRQTDADSFIRFAMPSNGDPLASALGGGFLSSIDVPTITGQAEAEPIIARARALALEIENEARQNSSELIAAEVQNEIMRTIDPWHEQLAETLVEVNNLLATIATRAERDLVRLAIEIAKKVVHREVTIDNEIVMTLARIGISRMQNRVAATIHLHPDDFAYVTTHRENLEAGHALELIEDRSIGRGGCLVQTEMGDVDTRIEQQFAEIERAFLG